MTNPAALWKDLTITALLGTSRKPFQPAGGSGAIQVILSKAGKHSEVGGALDPESRLLRQAAILSLYQRAGRLPAQAVPAAMHPCPADTRPRCSARAGNFLEQIFTAGRMALLPEWLEIAAQRGQRAREEHLSLLLESQKSSLSLRSALLPVLGERGRWLAAQNPGWSVFTTCDDERVWHEGQRRERLVFLTDLRARDPQRARLLLQGTWNQESAGERVTFLGVLEDHLSMDDEDFLENVLGDRRKDVRQAAAGLLACLPKSRLVQRMAGRVKRLAAWKNGLLSSRLEVSLPDTCDEGMLRDGLEARLPAGSALGEKAWWLAQMVGMVPPATWCATWNKRPSAILEAVRKHEWENALLMGLKDAAVRCGDAEWLEALVLVETKRENTSLMIAFFPRLPAALKETLMLSLLRAKPSLGLDQPASVYLSACRHSWTREMSQAVTSAICHNLTTLDTAPWRWEKLLREIAPRFHPDILEAAIHRIAAADEKKEHSDPYARNLISVLEFRLEMRQAFNN